MTSPSPPRIVYSAFPAPTAEDPTAKAKADAAAASAKQMQQRRQGYSANILTAPKVGPRAISLLGGGERVA